MKKVPEDVLNAETCKNEHKWQFIEVGPDGVHWQICPVCKRRLVVR